MKAKIWCDVVCNECGGMVGYFYKNKNTIKRIKEEIKDWKWVDGVNICGDCLKKIKEDMGVKEKRT